MAVDLPCEPYREPPSIAVRAPAIQVLPWATPATETAPHRGLDPRSAYVEVFWLPILGPTATFVVRKLAERFEVSPEGFVVDQAELAASIGIGGPDTRHAPLRRALQRCARYGLVRPAGPGTVEARRTIGPVPRHRLVKLPTFLQAMHREWEPGHREWEPGPR